MSHIIQETNEVGSFEYDMFKIIINKLESYDDRLIDVKESKPFVTWDRGVPAMDKSFNPGKTNELVRNSNLFNQFGLFIHIPKAAGTSLCKILSPHVVRNFKCATASFIKDHIDGELWDRLFKVAWVRNPYERVASLWKYTGLETLEGHHNLDFNTWLYDPQITTHCLEFDKEPFFKRNPLTAFTYVSDVDGNMLVDFIGRLEYMKEDLNKLNELLSTSFKSAHLNDRNLGKNYREIYDDETKGYVADICKWEIEKFGYEF